MNENQCPNTEMPQINVHQEHFLTNKMEIHTIRILWKKDRAPLPDGNNQLE